MNKPIELGALYEDVITGFKGVAVAETRYLTGGCNQVSLTPKIDEKGALKESHWFDDNRLKKLNSEKIVLDNAKTPGFDSPAPKI